MARRLRFGHQLSGRTEGDPVAAAVRAEELGFDVVLTADHVGNGLAPMPTLAAIATAEPERDGKTFKLPFEVKIPPALTLLPSAEGLSGGYTVYVAVGTPQGAISTVFRQPQPVRIAAAAEKSFRKEPLMFGATLNVRPGENIISIGVVDQVSGELAFTRTTVVAK